MLRKSGVAIRKSKTPKKTSTRGATETTNARGVTEETEATSEALPVNRNSKQERQAESEDSESDSDGQPLTSRRIKGKSQLTTLPEGQYQSVPKQKGTEQAVTESVATKNDATVSAAGTTVANEQTGGAIRRKKKHERGRTEMERKI